MDCEHVTELLPWYLNHSLKPAERQEVEQHLSQCRSCQAELRDTCAAGATLGQHVPPKDLVDYAFARPCNGVSEERITQHLESCDDCRSELAMIRDSNAALSRTDDPAEVTARVGRSRRDSSWRWLAAAASLACIVTACGWWEEVEKGRRSQVNHPVVQLHNLLLRGGEPADIDTIPREAEKATLILTPYDQLEGDNMKLELIDGEGNIEELGDKPVLTESQDYTVLLSTGRLESGSYQLRLSGEQDGEREVLAEFPFRIE
jgi:predicted anti-sigma-YlaC factor YlaD